MFRSLTLFCALAAAATACTPSGAADAAAQRESPLVPRGATIGPEGYATVLDAPPAPFTPAPSGAPKPLTPDQVAAHEQFKRAGEFQNQVREEVETLTGRLRRAEAGNFVDLYYENEGEPHVVFRFLRNGPETLRRYTMNPRFVGATAKYSMAELAAALDFMMETFRDDRIIMGGGYGNKQNRAVIDVAITEHEFWDLVRRKGVSIPEAVQLEFRATSPAREINGPLAPQIAPFVRILPRDDRPVGAVNSINSFAKVVLQDGCFRAPSHGSALVLFPLGAQLFIDSEGYLAFGSEESPGYGRVGEEVVFMGSIGEVTAPELVRPIHAACGAGKVIKINGMQSASAARAQESVSANFNALRQLKEMYGLSEPQALAALEKCKQQVGFGTCILSPPPPVRSQKDCPNGTKLSFGLCRTPEGFIRPLPQWLQAIVG